VLNVRDLEIRVGARLLMDGVTFRVDKGDKIGLVGRNGAGKTTMTKTLAGETQPTGGVIERGGGLALYDVREGAPRGGQRHADDEGVLVLLVHRQVVDEAEVDDVDAELGVDDLLEGLDGRVELLRGERDGHGQDPCAADAAAVTYVS